MKVKLNIYRKDEASSWVFRKYIGGEARFLSLKTKNKSIAKVKAKKLMSILEKTNHDWIESVGIFQDGRKPIDKSNPLVSDIPRLYKEFLDQAEHKPSEPTANHYLSCFLRIASDCNAKKVADLTSKALKQWKVDARARGLAEKSIHSNLMNAKAVFKKAAMVFYRDEKNLIMDNPFENVELPKLKVTQYKAVTQDTRDEVETKYKDLPPVQQMIFILGYRVGLRRNEIDKCRLSWFVPQDGRVMMHIPESDLDEERNLLFEAKNHKAAGLPITEDLYRELKMLRKRVVKEYSKVKATRKALKKQVYLIPAKQRGTRKVKTVNNHIRIQKHVNALAKWLKSHGFNQGKPLHQLRKEAGSRIAAEHGLEEACNVLRHSSMDVTRNIYFASELKTIG